MPNQQTTKPQPEILLEQDYLIQIYDEQKQLIPVSGFYIHNFTISFDKKNITLSAYLTGLTDPISIKELQQSQTLNILYRHKTPPVQMVQHFEVLDVVGSTQGNTNSKTPLSYVVQFMLK
jgi:hypothetical protein